MFGLPIIIAALTLMGASPTLPVDCNPDTTSLHSAAGLTWFTGGTPTATHLDLNPEVCAGLLYLSLTPTERVQVRALNPGYNFGQAEGLALVVVLHESRHGSGDLNEASAECHAMQQFDNFAARYAPPDELSNVRIWGHVYDGGLPASYHEESCN
jgi:hypothetical protein